MHALKVRRNQSGPFAISTRSILSASDQKSILSTTNNKNNNDMAAWVAQQQHHQEPPATSMMARVDRLDLVLCYLEEMMQQHQQQQHSHRRISRSTASTCSPSTPTTGGGGGLMSDDDDDSASAASTPRGVGVGGSKSLSWRRGSSCRPAKEALEEAQAKGSLVDRIAFLEDRVLKMEGDMEIITPEKLTASTTTMSHGHDSRKDKDRSRSSSNNKKGLKSLVKSCVRGKLKTKD